MLDDIKRFQCDGKILDNGMCICAACGKRKKMAGMANPMSDSERKVICRDCMAEEMAARDGITKTEALKRRKRMFDSLNAFREIVFEKYLKENNKKEFDSLEEAREVVDLIMRTWNRLPKEFHDMTDSAPKKELKKIYRDVKVDFRTLSSAIKLKSGQKVGRNDPCPCGSGKKYKKCCG